MTGSSATVRAWGLAASTGMFLILYAVLDELNGSADLSSEPESAALAVGFPVMLLIYSIVGAVVASRRPSNPLGWVLCVAPLAFAVGAAAEQYATRGLLVDPGSVPGAEGAVWLSAVLPIPAVFALFTVFLLLFPNGRVTSPRWRPVLWLSAVGVTALIVGIAFRPGPFDDYDRIDNPLGLGGPAGEVANGLAALAWVVLLPVTVASAISLIVRFRRARGEERLKIKWVAAAAGVAAMAWTLSFILWESAEEVAGFLPLVGLTAIPIAAGVAILRYRLYDIDVVINRALVYAVLTATLAGAYLGSVLVLQLALSPLTEQSDVAIAGSTLAVAALFRPARTRIQAAVDRRFYRRRYDARRTLESFAARLRNEVALETLSADLRRVVADTMQPAHVSLWMRHR